MPQFRKSLWLSLMLLSPLTLASSQIRSERVMKTLAPKVGFNQHALLQVAAKRFDGLIQRMNLQSRVFKTPTKPSFWMPKNRQLSTDTS